VRTAHLRARPGVPAITAIGAGKPCNDHTRRAGPTGPISWVGRVAGVAVRRWWTSGVLAAINLIVIALAALVLLRPAPVPAAMTLPQVGDPLPPGATACLVVVYDNLPGPLNAGARGTPMTTCEFVEQVRRAYVMSSAGQLTVVSPVTRKPYEMQCTPAGSYVTCTGGQDAIVYLYHR
jgi:hypothetical protein